MTGRDRTKQHDGKAVVQRYFDDAFKDAFRDQTLEEDRKFLVDVGPRLILPGLERDIIFINGRRTVYLQFDRPLKAAERGVVSRMGVRFYGSIASHTYLVRLKDDALEDIRKHTLLRGIEPVLSVDRLTAALYTGNVSPHTLTPQGTLRAIVRFYEGTKLAQALSLLDRLGTHVDDRSRMLLNDRLYIQATRDQILELVNSQIVRSVKEEPPPPVDDNATAAMISNVDDVQASPFNLDGDGVVAGQWESGHAETTHADLTPRVTVEENGAGTTDHGTHVAGTIMSSGANNTTAMGMSPSLDEIVAYDSGGDPATEQSDAVNDYAIVIANHSWGSVAGWNQDSAGVWSDTGNDGSFGSYNGTAADWDTLVRDTGLIVVKSAGNDGNDCDPADATDCDGFFGGDGFSYDTITNQGNSKNIITVGAVTDGSVLTAFSSAGPADDGRIKPDVVANGASLTSTCIGNTYCPKSGTSMSAPTTTGAIGLLIERYRDRFSGIDPSPDIVKALLVNTAMDLGRPGPDYLNGHGLVDALAAVNTIDVGAVRIITNSVDQDDSDTYLVAVNGGLASVRFTLNWIDPEGAANNASADLINDLDIEAVAPDGTTFFPFTGPGSGAVTARRGQRGFHRRRDSRIPRFPDHRLSGRAHQRPSAFRADGVRPANGDYSRVVGRPDRFSDRFRRLGHRASAHRHTHRLIEIWRCVSR